MPPLLLYVSPNLPLAAPRSNARLQDPPKPLRPRERLKLLLVAKYPHLNRHGRKRIVRRYRKLLDRINLIENCRRDRERLGSL